MSANLQQPIKRLDVDGLRALVGDEAFERLKNKQRGGENGHKGVRYEHLFLAHRAARLIRKYVENGIDAALEWQSDGFVDDVVVRKDEEKSFKGYQLKNSPAAKWTDEITGDFKSQKLICDREAYSHTRLRLVCSDEAVAKQLAANIPNDIASYSKAFFFPYSVKALLPLLKDQEWLRDDFAYLSKKDNASTVDVEQVASVLMGACDSLGQRFTVSEVMTKARDMSPTLLRAVQSDADAEALLIPDFREILATWSDFTYRISRGFFCWTAFGDTMSGSLSMDCFDPKFTAWQQYIVQQRPGAFQDVEGAFV